MWAEMLLFVILSKSYISPIHRFIHAPVWEFPYMDCNGKQVYWWCPTNKNNIWIETVMDQVVVEKYYYIRSNMLSSEPGVDVKQI